MGQPGELLYHGISVYVYANGHGKKGAAFCEFIRGYDLSQGHNCRLLIWDLYANRGLTGDQEYPYLDTTHGTSKVVGERYHLAEFYAGGRLKLIHRNYGTRTYVQDITLGAKVRQQLLEGGGIPEDILLGKCLTFRVFVTEEFYRWQQVSPLVYCGSFWWQRGSCGLGCGGGGGGGDLLDGRWHILIRAFVRALSGACGNRGLDGVFRPPGGRPLGCRDILLQLCSRRL
ncbi:hypothetical protein MBAV_005500 [Candidatus Magnetobacterium bavaricum]|uniref:Uncharacterized protein n=1 Tax=Candidatus Magnetobacterium bavaricum TaxID=29290 RepID=A0A0F3GKF8_9BACT|nr:hypothetical protein MBAV_005500 [Candidatus Magnetobacterium bavaricum]